MFLRWRSNAAGSVSHCFVSIDGLFDLRLRVSMCWRIVLKLMLERFERGRGILVSGLK